MSLLSVEQLHKSFTTGLWGASKVLNDVSFEIAEGKITGFIGANGSGKTTTIKCIFDLIHADSGTIRFWNNQSISSAVKMQIGFLPESPKLYDFLTASETLKYFYNIHSIAGDFNQLQEQALTDVGLIDAKDKTVKSFSKGMQQRLGLAILLIKKPRFLILDEPMSGLDPEGRGMIKRIIKNLNAKGITILFSTHIMSDIIELCDDLIVIQKGKIVYRTNNARAVRETDLMPFFDAESGNV
jgi:ABC-2 type transport system ATP-binding protein